MREQGRHKGVRMPPESRNAMMENAGTRCERARVGYTTRQETEKALRGKMQGWHHDERHSGGGAKRKDKYEPSAREKECHEEAGTWGCAVRK